MSPGRLIHVKDGSGATALIYGSMGEVVRTVRRIVVNPDPEHLQTHTFVSESEYDSWGRILSMTYLDGEVVKYGYHSGTGELASVKSGDNTYSYDKADNITQIYGSSNKYEQNYEYDEFNRLIRATGRCSCVFNGGKNCSYDVSYKYNIMSGFDKVSKNIQKYDENKNEFVSIEGKNAYLYGDIQPGAPVKVGDAEYKYDASGNPVSMRGGDSDRTLKYDAENRLRVIEDTHNGTMSLYTYNHTGECSLKRYGAFNTAYLNGAYAGSGLDGLTRYSAYVSPYYVEHGTGVNASTATKHYYIGTERLVSKLVTEKGGKEDVKDEDTYYYFTDHLGSTTHITDKGGNVVQYAAYTPYGTLFREYKSVMPYKFNGKELDQETGYYYYGARYYDPSVALWLGVDPLAEKYPGVSPYVYCHGNPVRLIDPTGMEDEEANPLNSKQFPNLLPEAIATPENKNNNDVQNNKQLNGLTMNIVSTLIETVKVDAASKSKAYNELGDVMETYVGDGTAAKELGQTYQKVSQIARGAGRIISGICISNDLYDVATNGVNMGNSYNLAKDIVSATGLTGILAAVSMDVYKMSAEYIIDVYNDVNSKWNNTDNWFNYYNFGY